MHNITHTSGALSCVVVLLIWSINFISGLKLMSALVLRLVCLDSQVQIQRAHTHAHICTHMHPYANVHMCTHMHTYAHACTHMHTQAHTCILAMSSLGSIQVLHFQDSNVKPCATVAC